jgi:sugar/nucleoside kinase (ribokinase family)
LKRTGRLSATGSDFAIKITEDSLMYDVMCIGQTFCDLIFSDLEVFPELKKEMRSKNFYIKPGGAVNTPVALSKLGVKALFCTTVGNDILGKIIYDNISESGIDLSAVIRDDAYRTSVSAVLSMGEERGFATYFAPFDYKRIVKEIEKYAQCCTHIHAYLEDCLHIPIVDIAKKYNKTLSIDTGWDEAIKFDHIKHIIAGSTIFMMNEIEAMSITEANTIEEAIEMVSKYAEIAVIKLGKYGCLVKRGSEVIKVPSISSIHAVDSTGAGDLFGAGFIYGHIKKWNLERCAKFATASGNLAVTFYGGMDESYTLDKVESFYNMVITQKVTK